MYSVLHVVTYPPPHHNIFMCIYTILSFTVQYGASPLFMASQNGHTDIVDLLLKAGADVHQTYTVLLLYICMFCQTSQLEKLHVFQTSEYVIYSFKESCLELRDTSTVYM